MTENSFVDWFGREVIFDGNNGGRFRCLSVDTGRQEIRFSYVGEVRDALKPHLLVYTFEDFQAEIDGGRVELLPLEPGTAGKTLHNSDASGARANVEDLKIYGNGDTFKLICKASSAAEGWLKSTKAMEIPGVGCVVQVTTQQGGQVAEALTFVPGVRIAEDLVYGGRRLLPLVEGDQQRNPAQAVPAHVQAGLMVFKDGGKQ